MSDDLQESDHCNRRLVKDYSRPSLWSRPLRVLPDGLQFPLKRVPGESRKVGAIQTNGSAEDHGAGDSFHRGFCQMFLYPSEI